jgi:hypothetical protein
MSLGCRVESQGISSRQLRSRKLRHKSKVNAKGGGRPGNGYGYYLPLPAHQAWMKKYGKGVSKP